MIDIPSTNPTSEVRSRGESTRWAAAPWQGVALIALGWSGVGLAYSLARLARGSDSMGAQLWTAAVSVTSVAIIAGGAAVVFTAARSPTRHVFPFRALAWAAAGLIGIAVGAFAVLAVRRPFDGIAAHGKPLAEVICDMTFIAAALTCLAGGVGAAWQAGLARHDERTWVQPAASHGQCS